ncbi:unnamed protein product, partial [Ceratitis capitata]
HDSFVWNISSAQQHYLTQYEACELTNILLGDSGYIMAPFLLTQYRDLQYNTRE